MKNCTAAVAPRLQHHKGRDAYKRPQPHARVQTSIISKNRWRCGKWRESHLGNTVNSVHYAAAEKQRCTRCMNKRERTATTKIKQQRNQDTSKFDKIIFENKKKFTSEMQFVNGSVLFVAALRIHTNFVSFTSNASAKLQQTKKKIREICSHISIERQRFFFALFCM